MADLDLGACRRAAENYRARGERYWPDMVLALLHRIEELERHNRMLLDRIKEDAPLGLG